jgi:NAD(P)-dependent dehydrogenase (short-subunit alcohol dehydrogenase family)
MRLKDKIAVVTGAYSGIGRAVADEFILQGAKVVYSDIKEIKGLEGNALFVKADVSNSGDIKNLIEKTIDKFGSLDIIVNNAGTGSLGGVLDESDENFARTLKINLTLF